MNAARILRVTALLLAAIAGPACRQRPQTPPPLPQLEERPDRPFYEGTERMQEDLRELLAAATAAHGQDRIELGTRILAYGEPATPLLIRTLAHDDATMRVFAAWLLGLSKDPRVLSSLDAARDDPDESVRFEAATAMVRLGDPRGLETLVVGLEHTDPRVRGRSIAMLEHATGDTFGFRPDDDRSERKPAVARWRAWLKQTERKAE